MENYALLKQRATRFILLFLGIAVAAITLYYLSKLIYPFLIATVIAIAINPCVNFIERKIKAPRSVAVILTIILVLLMILLFVSLITAEIVTGSNYLAKETPKHINSLITELENYTTHTILPLYNNIASQFNNLDATYQNTIIENTKNFSGTIGKTIGSMIETIFKTIPLLLGQIPSAATILIFSLMATFFISKDWTKFTSLLRKSLPNTITEKSNQVLIDLKRALFSFIRAQAILISITTVIVLVGLLALRVEHAITIALVVGIVDLIPYLGTGLVFVPWIIYSFFVGNTGLGLGLLILYIVIVIQRQIAEPKVLSSSIGLEPLAVLVALFVGFQLFGFVGLIIGPTILVIFKALYQAGVLNDIWSYIMHGAK